MEYLPLVKTLSLGWPYLRQVLLASVYQAMSKYVSNKPYRKVGGALWFVQMWLFAYFPKLLDREPIPYNTYALHVAHSLHTMPYDDHVFFLGIGRSALVHLYLRPDYVHIST